MRLLIQKSEMIKQGDIVPIAPKIRLTMRLKIRVDNTIITASIIKSKTSDDFIRLLPFSFTMNDLFDREKYGALPASISIDTKPFYHYEVGDIAYWSPAYDLAIYYKHDGETIPDPGIIIVGKIESDLAPLALPGPVNVTMAIAG